MPRSRPSVRGAPCSILTRRATGAQTVFDRMKEAVRAGRLTKRDDRGPDGPLTFAQFAQLYAEKHARAKGLALAKTIDYRA